MFGSGRKDKDKKKESDPISSGVVSGGNHGAVMVGGPGAVTSAGVVASHHTSHGSGSKDKKKEKEKEKEKKDSKPKLKLKKSKTVDNDSDNGKGKSNFFYLIYIILRNSILLNIQLRSLTLMIRFCVSHETITKTTFVYCFHFVNKGPLSMITLFGFHFIY